MGKGIMRYTALLCCLLLIASVGGVFATWHYATDSLTPVDSKIPVTVTDFKFSDITDEETEEVTKSLAQKFLEILNSSTDYAMLTGAMDDNYDGSRAWTASYIGNVAGSSSDDTTLLLDLFDGELSLEVNGTHVDVTCIIKRENIDGSTSTGASYRVGRTTYRGCEMTLYLTTANFDRVSYNDYPPVYAMVFTKPSTNSDWVQVGEEMYAGTAQVVGYVGGTTTGSFDTGTWRSSQEYHGVSTGATISMLIQAPQ